MSTLRRRWMFLVPGALVLALVVAAGIVRYDAGRIDSVVVGAREAGDCTTVQLAAAQFDSLHRIVAAGKAKRAKEDVAACDRLDGADAEFKAALWSTTGQAKGALGVLDQVLADPRQRGTTTAVLDDFLANLRVTDSCSAVVLADQLQARKVSPVLQERIRSALVEIEPAALRACAAERMKDSAWDEAHNLYRRAVDRYPDDLRAGEARAGAVKANQQQELENVQELIDDPESYCDSPARYSAAPPYRRGLNRAVVLGSSIENYAARLPKQWRTNDAAAATTVTCAEVAMGKAVRTCPYLPKLGFESIYVTFHKMVLSLKVYELRTGKRVVNKKILVDGLACPNTLHYQSSTGFSDPDPAQFVVVPDKNLRAAFQPSIVRP
ncbi:hypothetical protein E1263_11455 [Kribbella antibiotica]|uniref:Uncharacterized protein n=1 Tax=Kribbella antibiotica TaxID=190195 RepID=A0A4R4ZQQ8_9ACTN|nr:hypothetical protein [Kribbella antibiotica]TDD60384.1 hypothetical protein E1263_11455 [Kribbella antibiotica]